MMPFAAMLKCAEGAKARRGRREGRRQEAVLFGAIVLGGEVIMAQPISRARLVLQEHAQAGRGYLHTLASRSRPMTVVTLPRHCFASASSTCSCQLRLIRNLTEPGLPFVFVNKQYVPHALAVSRPAAVRRHSRCPGTRPLEGVTCPLAHAVLSSAGDHIATHAAEITNRTHYRCTRSNRHYKQPRAAIKI
jgi:hypothetical protein